MAMETQTQISPDAVKEAPTQRYRVQLEDGRTLDIEAESHEAALAGAQHFMEHNPARDTSMLGALSQGAANTVRGIGQSIGVAPGGSKAIEQSADKVASGIERPNYEPTQVVKDGALNAAMIPRAIAEAAPGAALPIAVGSVAKRFLGSRIGLLAGLATAGAEYFGPNVKARATAEGHDEPTTGDKVLGGATTAAQMAADAVGLRRFMPGVNPITTVGIKGITDSAKVSSPPRPSYPGRGRPRPVARIVIGQTGDNHRHSWRLKHRS